MFVARLNLLAEPPAATRLQVTSEPVAKPRQRLRKGRINSGSAHTRMLCAEHKQDFSLFGRQRNITNEPKQRRQRVPGRERPGKKKGEPAKRPDRRASAMKNRAELISSCSEPMTACRWRSPQAGFEYAWNMPLPPVRTARGESRREWRIQPGVVSSARGTVQKLETWFRHTDHAP